VKRENGLEVWSKQLADGGRAVVLLNRSGAAAPIHVDWADIGYPNHLPATVRDLWSGKTANDQRGGYTAQVASHAAVMLRVMP